MPQQAHQRGGKGTAKNRRAPCYVRRKKKRGSLAKCLQNGSSSIGRSRTQRNGRRRYRAELSSSPKLGKEELNDFRRLILGLPLVVNAGKGEVARELGERTVVLYSRTKGHDACRRRVLLLGLHFTKEEGRQNAYLFGGTKTKRTSYGPTRLSSRAGDKTRKEKRQAGARPRLDYHRRQKGGAGDTSFFKKTFKKT